ncbi:MAG TPA: RAD55 family ATPase [Thermoplasmata archaeon]|nr:RAD55 family ATPase [Thermoplasmata archaeon]
MGIEAPRPWLPPYEPIPSPAGATGPASVERVPTGVADFDHLSGGIPAGSVVLLAGEAGSGHQEFALTSATHVMLHYDEPQLHQFFLGSTPGPFVYPKGVVYVSLSRSREQVLREVRGAFHTSYPDVLERHLTFHDLSPTYFSDSVVPVDWSSVNRPLLSELPATVARGTPSGALPALADALEASGANNLVIVDSLTDLLVRRGVDTEELLTLVKGLRRRAKSWGGIIYLLLSRGVGPAATEQALYDSVDGVLAFTWSSSPFHSHRQRTMLIEKFMPVLSRVPPEYQGRFVIRIHANSGLVTTQYERV